MMKSLFEQNVGTYSDQGDYRFPNLSMPEESKLNLGIWGQRRLDYLKKHRRILYTNLLTSGRLTENLREIDIAACERWESIVRQMAEAQGISEALKSTDQMMWVGKMNNIRACAVELVQNELIQN